MLGFGRFVRSTLTQSTSAFFKSSQKYSYSTSVIASKVDKQNTHLEVSSMVNKQILVTNAFALINLREMLLKSRSETSGLLEEI